MQEFDTTEQNLELFGDDIGLDKKAWRASAQLEWDLGGLTVRSNTGYFSADVLYGYDVDITSNSTALGGTFNRIAVSDRREWSTELLVSTDVESATRLLGGVYLYQSRRDFREDRLKRPHRGSGRGAHGQLGRFRIGRPRFFGHGDGNAGAALRLGQDRQRQSGRAGHASADREHLQDLVAARHAGLDVRGGIA